MYPYRPRECDLTTPASVFAALFSCATEYCKESRMKETMKNNRRYFKLNLRKELLQYIISIFI
jgi:hypothetical protein